MFPGKKKKKTKQWSCSTLTSGIALPRVLITVCQRHRVPTSRAFFFFSFATCTGVFILYHEASSMLSLYPSFFPHFPSLTLPWGSFFFFSIADKLSNKQKIIKKKKVQQQKRNTVAAEKKKTVLLCVLKRKGEEPKKQTSLFFFFHLSSFSFSFFFLLRITLLRFLFHRQCQGGGGNIGAHGCGGDQKDNQAAMYVPSTASKMVVAVVVVLVVCMYVCVKRLRFFFSFARFSISTIRRVRQLRFFFFFQLLFSS